MAMQQINLFNPRFTSRKKLLSIRSIVFICLLALFANLAAWLWFDYLNSQAEQQYSQLLQTQKQQQARIAKSVDELTTGSSKEKLQSRLQILTQQSASEQQKLDHMQKLLGSASGYSEYLHALTQGGFTNVWLTGMRISGAGEGIQLRVQAATLYPTLIPDYLAQLRKQTLFNGTAGVVLRLGHVAAAEGEYIRFDMLAGGQEVMP